MLINIFYFVLAGVIQVKRGVVGVATKSQRQHSWQRQPPTLFPNQFIRGILLRRNCFMTKLRLFGWIVGMTRIPSENVSNMYMQKQTRRMRRKHIRGGDFHISEIIQDNVPVKGITTIVKNTPQSNYATIGTENATIDKTKITPTSMTTSSQQVVSHSKRRNGNGAEQIQTPIVDIQYATKANGGKTRRKRRRRRMKK
jgi:hypothetical protein